MNEVIKVINYIKSNSLWTRIFASLCEAMNFDHKVRWLSKEKVLERAIFLRIEIVSFFDTEDTYRFNFHDDMKCYLVTWSLVSEWPFHILNLNFHDGAKENIITITGNSSHLKRNWNFGLNTQNLFEVNLTIAGVKIGHDPKWGYHNLIQACTSLR
jgi:hypothetical protein